MVNLDAPKMVHFDKFSLHHAHGNIIRRINITSSSLGARKFRAPFYALLLLVNIAGLIFLLAPHESHT